MTRKRYTDDEIILCAYIAKFSNALITDKKISRLENRSVDSIKMKIQNIAAMLSEEGYETSNSISKLTGKTTGESGRKTDWDIVSTYLEYSKDDFYKVCRQILSK